MTTRKVAESLQESFERFDAQYPDVYRLFKHVALVLRARGHKRYSAKAILEKIPWHESIGKLGIDNRFTSRYARKLIAEKPQMAGFFELRKLQTP